MGFYARVSHESHLFSRLNICKFHLQTVGQSFQHQRPQFYSLPTLKIFWWEIALSPSVLHRWGFYKADLQSHFHQIHLWQGIKLQFIGKTFNFKWELNFSPVISCSGKTPYIPMHHHMMLIQHGCHQCPAALNAKSIVELEHRAKRNKQNRWSGTV